jgi:hypothetical protein
VASGIGSDLKDFMLRRARIESATVSSLFVMQRRYQKKRQKKASRGGWKTGFRGGENFGISEPTWNGEGLTD